MLKVPEILRFIPDHLKAKEMYKNVSEKLPFVIRYLFDWYKTQEICNKAVLENDGTLQVVSDSSQILKMCD